MKNIFNEIKFFRRMMKLNESFINSNAGLIGDDLVYYLNDENITIIGSLTKKNMTIMELLSKLENSIVDEDIDYIFISIGLGDDFNKKEMISLLIERIRDVFPNARISAIQNILDQDYFYGGESEKDLKNLQEKIQSFYDDFKINGVDVIKYGDSVIENLGLTRQKLEVIKNKMESSLISKDLYNNKEDEENLEIDSSLVTKSNNIKIEGEDQTDFDSIYEFLERFELIYKSKNSYSKKTPSGYALDIEQIQIALNFLTSSDIEVNGKYDMATEDAVAFYQLDKGLPETGVCDHDTLEEIFYDLKIKGFDEEDLGMFISLPKLIMKQYGIDNYDLPDYCDKIIDNIEGGYANEAHFKASAKDIENLDVRQAVLNSSETMFGIDRFAGEWDKHPVGKDFWQLIDENSGWAPESAGKPKWTHGYMGGSLEGDLRDYVYDMMIPSYEDLKSAYLNDDAAKIVEEDKRLVMHFLYATWNGSGFFQDFANIINKEVSSGNTDRDNLYQVAIDSRKNHPNDLVKKTGAKLEKLISTL
jgi:peptidoglycan hydrolase-like protein with peptidoglycan-binding domain